MFVSAVYAHCVSLCAKADRKPKTACYVMAKVLMHCQCSKSSYEREKSLDARKPFST